MVTSMVDRATSDMLIGPDWAMNIEICDMCNRDPSQAKDVVRGIKKRLGSKNPKVQLLALTLLETLIKNCGDIVHMHVAEKDVLREMVKIVKKKPDFHVKEKILILIDTWQEAFGGPRGRYPQYYAAYQDLLRIGAVFPQRSESSAPVFTPPQTHPLASYPQNLHNPESRDGVAESSAEAEFPTLNLTEIQNARGIMDVLAEMLNALDPGNKEGLRQEVIVDLVEQCRTYKQRVVHLVNSTSDESLLSLGLTLNDDLQRVLAKHEAIASGTSVKTEKPNPQPVATPVKVDAPLIDTGDNKQPDQRSKPSSSLDSLLLLPAPTTVNVPSTSSKTEAKFDLLSGDDFSLAIVPVGEPQPPSPASQQNALVLVDMFSQTTNAQSTHSVGQTPSAVQFQQQQNLTQKQSPYPNNGISGNMLSQYGRSPSSLQVQQHQNLQSLKPAIDRDGITGNMIPQYGQSPLAHNSSTWNNQLAQQQQPSSLNYGVQSGSSLPPPPWEAEPTDNSQIAAAHPQPMPAAQVVIPQSYQMPSGAYSHGQSLTTNQFGGMYIQPVGNGHLAAFNKQLIPNNPSVGINQQLLQGGQFVGMLPQPIPSGQMPYMYQQIYSNQMASYGYNYGMYQNPQVLEQGMSGLSVSGNAAFKNSSLPISSASYVPPGKPSNPKDNLFGDLVDITKFKSPKGNPGRAGST